MLDTNDMTIADAARVYVENGYPVMFQYRPVRDASGLVTCSCGIDISERPDHKIGKHPITKLHPRGSKTACRTLEQVERAIAWLEENHQEANLALVLPEGVAVIDLDAARGAREVSGMQSLQAWAKEHPSPTWANISHAPSERSGNGGLHVYVRDLGITQRTGLIPGVDYLPSGANVTVAPSVGASGQSYRWTRPLVPAAEIPEVPQPLAQFLVPKGGVSKLTPGTKGVAVSIDLPALAAQLGGTWPRRVEAWGASAVRRIKAEFGSTLAQGPGRRNAELFKQAASLYQLVQLHLAREEDVAELRKMAIEGGLDPDEVLQTMRSARQRSAGSNRMLKKGLLVDLVATAEATGIELPLVAAEAQFELTARITPERYEAFLAEATKKLMGAKIANHRDLVEQVQNWLKPALDGTEGEQAKQAVLAMCEYAANRRGAAVPSDVSVFLAEDVAYAVIQARKTQASATQEPQELAEPEATASPQTVSPQTVNEQEATKMPEEISHQSVPQGAVPPGASKAGGQSNSSPNTASPALLASLTARKAREFVEKVALAVSFVAPTWAERYPAAKGTWETIQQVPGGAQVADTLLSLAGKGLPEDCDVDLELVVQDSFARARGTEDLDKNPDAAKGYKQLVQAMAGVGLPAPSQQSWEQEIRRARKSHRPEGFVPYVSLANSDQASEHPELRECWPTVLRYGEDEDRRAAAERGAWELGRYLNGLVSSYSCSPHDVVDGWTRALSTWHPLGGKAPSGWAYQSAQYSLTRENVKAQRYVSLSQLLGRQGFHESEDMTIADRLADPGPSVEDQVLARNDPSVGMRSLELSWMRKHLTDTQTKVLGHVYGVWGYEQAPYSEIAQKMGMTEADVRYEERQALDRCRQSTLQDLALQPSGDDVIERIVDLCESASLRPSGVVDVLADRAEKLADVPMFAETKKLIAQYGSRERFVNEIVRRIDVRQGEIAATKQPTAVLSETNQQHQPTIVQQQVRRMAR